MDIIERIDELIAEAEKEPGWTAIQALRCLRKELLLDKRRAKTNARTFSIEEVFNMSGLTVDDLLNAEDVEIES